MVAFEGQPANGVRSKLMMVAQLKLASNYSPCKIVRLIHESKCLQCDGDQSSNRLTVRSSGGFFA
jgi:hypothetical protein